MQGINGKIIIKIHPDEFEQTFFKDQKNKGERLVSERQNRSVSLLQMITNDCYSAICSLGYYRQLLHIWKSMITHVETLIYTKEAAMVTRATDG